MHRYGLLWIVLLAAGCATTSGGGDWTHFSEGSLDAWLVREATPAFTETLSQHPRFKQETIRVAVMTGDSVQLRTNALSASLRDAIHARLLRVPGLTLVREDSPQDCRAPAHGYYLGVELTRTGSTQARAQLRLFDVVEQQWVSGFTSQWQGELKPSQQRLADKPEISENARGLRVLPFEAGQSDLLAAYLARDLACELHRRGDDELVVQPARHTAAALLAGNLTSDHGIAVGSAGQLVLDTRIHEVGDGLYQVWAIMTPEGDTHGRTLAASAYAKAPLLRKPAGTQPASEPVKSASVEQAAGPVTPPTAKKARRPATQASANQAPRPNVKRAPELARRARLVPSSSRTAQAAPLLRMAQIVTPANMERCSGRFWRGDAVTQGKEATMSHDDCYAIEFDAHPQAQIFIVGLDNAAGASREKLVRLYPSSCSPGGLSRGDLAARRFPAGRAIGWDGRAGTETIFIIAARDRAAAGRIETLVRALPAACSQHATQAAGRVWLDRLDALAERLGDSVTVRALHIRHTPDSRRAAN